MECEPGCDLTSFCVFSCVKRYVLQLFGLHSTAVLSEGNRFTRNLLTVRQDAGRQHLVNSSIYVKMVP